MCANPLGYNSKRFWVISEPHNIFPFSCTTALLLAVTKLTTFSRAGSNYQADKSTLTSQAEWDTLYLWTPQILDWRKGQQHPLSIRMPNLLIFLPHHPEDTKYSLMVYNQECVFKIMCKKKILNSCISEQKGKKKPQQLSREGTSELFRECPSWNIL